MYTRYTLRLFVLPYLFWGLLSCKVPQQPPLKTLPNLQDITPMILEEKGTEIHQYWEFEEQEGLWEVDFEIPTAIASFRDSLKLTMGADTLEYMLNRESKIAEKGELPLDSLDNWQIVHRGYAGNIRKINYLEAQMLNYQISRFPLFSHPTEFHGFILRNESSQMIRVYMAASDAPFPPKPYAITEAVDSLSAEGWNLIFHLHNHYRQPEENYLGAMGPSMADTHYYKNLHKRVTLGHALVTNGYTTCVISPEELPVFNSH